MKSSLVHAGAVSLALFLAGCDGSASKSGNPAPGQAGASGTAPPLQAEVPTAGGLVIPTSWMPADWDRNVYPASGEPLTPEAIQEFRQNMLATVPLTLWAVANDTLVTEAFEPIWVWYTAIRSCERGIQMSEDLAGEFGNRERGKAALATARKELKAWSATQPPDMTMYFTAKLGQWNEASGAFPLQETSRATTLNLKDIGPTNSYDDGAGVELWTDRTGQAINHFQASLLTPQCASKDGTKVYKFPRMSQWWVVFGDVDTGMGGLRSYKSHEMLPAISITREDAASLVQRNPERKVIVAVKFVPAGSSFLPRPEQPSIRAKYRQVTVTDALDGSVLVSKTY